MKKISLCVDKCLFGEKEGDREIVWDRDRKRERDGKWERERYTQFWGGSIKGPFNRGRVGLTLKLNEHLWTSMTFEVIIFKMKS